MEQTARTAAPAATQTAVPAACIDYTSAGSIINFLKENKLQLSKKFGQNFLLDGNIIRKTVQLAAPGAGTSVWEIGPGLGALTSQLLATGANVTAFELDHGFCRVLQNLVFKDAPNFTLIEGNALKTWKPVFEKNGTPDLICANLPYNVGSVLIASFIENRCIPQNMVYTLQTEVAQRICAKPGQDNYSGFTVLTSIDYESTLEFSVKNTCFFPVPKVGSSVIRMQKKTPAAEEDSIKNLLQTIRILFSQRRKTITNNLRELSPDSQLTDNLLLSIGIQPSERAENLSLEQIIRISRLFRPSGCPD